MYTIEVLNYPVFCRLGYFPHERLVGQEILVSIEAHLSAAADPAENDDLAKTVDYGAFLVTVDEVLKGAEVHLVETACDRVAQRIMSRFSLVDHIQVTIEKTLLPKGVAKGSAVRVHRVISR